MEQTAYGKLIYEGKAKKIYQTESGHLIHYFKDSATAFNGQKKATIPGKGSLNNQFSCFFLKYLGDKGIPTHFIHKIDERSMESIKLKMLPIEVVVRNRVAGTLAKRLKMEEGKILPFPLVEWFLKDDERGDPQVSEELLLALFEQKKEILTAVRKIALQVNETLAGLFKKVNLVLVDFKL